MRRTSENNPADWYALADERLSVADRAFDSAKGICLTCVELLHEAAERYLKGYLISQGWELTRTHNLRFLVEEAELYEAAFAAFGDWASDLTTQFFAQHYPGGDLTNVGENFSELRLRLDELLRLIPR
jgi:HEPN domain-containing protein